MGQGEFPFWWKRAELWLGIWWGPSEQVWTCLEGHLWTEWQTDTTENITFSQLCWWVVMKVPRAVATRAYLNIVLKIMIHQFKLAAVRRCHSFTARHHVWEIWSRTFTACCVHNPARLWRKPKNYIKKHNICTIFHYLYNFPSPEVFLTELTWQVLIEEYLTLLLLVHQLSF